ncbi:hypothetical protein AB0A91_28780 [Streptomyces sp. NPDC042207]|uniref:hypothetical protein n=1 Tax=Streptomyces sp. NPDC042207 TaxID=3154331 RepID=UPI00340B7CC1
MPGLPHPFRRRRSYLIRDTSLGKKGTLINKSAVLERAVVNALREKPTAGKSSTTT